MSESVIEWVRLEQPLTKSGDVLLPRGEARVARMLFDPGMAERPDPRVPGVSGLATIGETIEVSDEFQRSVLLHRDTGEVHIQKLENRAHTHAINSSLGQLLSSIVVYELWHLRLLASRGDEEWRALSSEVIEHLARIDPECATRATGWWPSRVLVVGRLL